MPPLRELSVRRNPAVALAALVIIALALYHQTTASLVHLWTQPGHPVYHHGLVLVSVCVFLICRRWAELKGSIRLRPSISAAALILLASFVWLLATLVSVLVVQQVALLLLIALLIVSVVGFRSAWLFAFPAGLLILAVPIWDPVNPYLQWLTANASAFLVNLIGIPAVVEGTRILIPAGSFTVDIGCSGLAQLMVGTMAGALFAYWNRASAKPACLIVSAAVAVSLLANTLRVTIVVMAGQVSRMQHYLVTKDHYVFGWVLFAIAMLVFLLIARRLVADAKQIPLTSEDGAAMETVAATSSGHPVPGAVLAVCGLAFGPALLHAYQVSREEAAKQPMLILPEEIKGWRAASPGPEAYRPVFQNPDQESERRFTEAGGAQIYVYVAQYAVQEQGREADYYLNRVYDDKVWRLVRAHTQRLPDGTSVKETQIQSITGPEKLVWQWYYIHGWAVSDGYVAKFLNAWYSLQKKRDVAVVVVAADLDRSDENARRLLTRFVAESGQTVERAIADVQQH